MPKIVDCIDGRIAVSDIFRIEMVIIYLLSCLFIILCHLLGCKIVSDRFDFFSPPPVKFSLSLSKTPSRRYLYKTKALSVLYKPD